MVYSVSFCGANHDDLSPFIHEFYSLRWFLTRNWRETFSLRRALLKSYPCCIPHNSRSRLIFAAVIYTFTYSLSHTQAHILISLFHLSLSRSLSRQFHSTQCHFTVALSTIPSFCTSFYSSTIRTSPFMISLLGADTTQPPKLLLARNGGIRNTCTFALSKFHHEHGRLF
jgi:hypothetical protein